MTPALRVRLPVALLTLLALALLPGCAAVGVAGAAAGIVGSAAGAAVSVGGAVVGGTVKAAGKVVGKTIDVVVPGSEPAK